MTNIATKLREDPRIASAVSVARREVIRQIIFGFVAGLLAVMVPVLVIAVAVR